MSDTASFWDARYQTPGYLFGTEPNAFLRSKRHFFKPGQTVLALADGEGRNGIWLAEQGLDVLSTDISSYAGGGRACSMRPAARHGGSACACRNLKWGLHM